MEKKLLKVVPKEFKVDVHHWLILHGRYTCIARKPRCGSCIVEDLCEFKDKTEWQIRYRMNKMLCFYRLIHIDIAIYFSAL